MPSVCSRVKNRAFVDIVTKMFCQGWPGGEPVEGEETKEQNATGRKPKLITWYTDGGREGAGQLLLSLAPPSEKIQIP